jgi:hypothetical protein
VRRVVAIHQPNFLPWLGWFDKLARADVLVLLDATQFPRTSRGTWLNRVQMLVNRQPRWVTVPVVRAGRGTQGLREVRVDDAQPWREKLLRTISLSYARAPHFDEHFPLVREIVEQPTDLRAVLNELGVRRLAGALGLHEAKLVRASELDVTGNATELLVELTRAVGGTGYLSGDGASGYQDDELFAQAGLSLSYQQFEQRPYEQLGDGFTPGLSVVDALFSVGAERTRALLGA